MDERNRRVDQKACQTTSLVTMEEARQKKSLRRWVKRAPLKSEYAYSSNRYWAMSMTPVIHGVLSNKRLLSEGGYFGKVCVEGLLYLLSMIIVLNLRMRIRTFGGVGGVSSTPPTRLFMYL